MTHLLDAMSTTRAATRDDNNDKQFQQCVQQETTTTTNSNNSPYSDGKNQLETIASSRGLWQVVQIEGGRRLPALAPKTRWLLFSLNTLGQGELPQKKRDVLEDFKSVHVNLASLRKTDEHGDWRTYFLKKNWDGNALMICLLTSPFQQLRCQDWGRVHSLMYCKNALVFRAHWLFYFHTSKIT